MKKINAAFADAERAKSAAGRLEIAGVPAQSIIVSQDPLSQPKHRDSETVVTAEVEDEHFEKAIAILSDEGRLGT